jgi:hypothetical protein
MHQQSSVATLQRAHEKTLIRRPSLRRRMNTEYLASLEPSVSNVHNNDAALHEKTYHKKANNFIVMVL